LRPLAVELCEAPPLADLARSSRSLNTALFRAIRTLAPSAPFLFLILISSASHPYDVRSPGSGDVVEDLTRFGLVLISAPVVVVASGVVLGLIGRWIRTRRV
jgi:hypothetical protein